MTKCVLGDCQIAGDTLHAGSEPVAEGVRRDVCVEPTSFPAQAAHDFLDTGCAQRQYFVAGVAAVSGKDRILAQRATATAIGARLSAPGPTPMAAGSTPKTIERAVISTGRMRTGAAVRMAVTLSIPSSRSWLA